MAKFSEIFGIDKGVAPGSVDEDSIIDASVTLAKLDPAAIASLGGGGSGEKNYVADGSSNIFGWAVSAPGQVDITDTTVLAELPREITTTTGIKIVSTSGGTTAYAYYRFTLDDADTNKKMKITWAQAAVGAYQNDDYNVEMFVDDNAGYASPTQITMTSPEIKASTGTAIYTFDTTADLYYELRITSTAASGAGEGLVLSDVIVGPGSVVTSAVITAPTLFTPVWTRFGVAGAGAVNGGYWYREGEHMIINISGNTGAGFVAGGGIMSMDIPEGLSSNGDYYTAGANNAAADFGTMRVLHTAPVDLKIKLSDGGGTTMSFTSRVDNAGQSANYQSTSVPINTPFSLNARIPIAEWAGAGTVNLGTVPSVVSDLGNLTTTGSWTTNTTYVGSYARVGNRLQGSVKLSLAGAPTTTALIINLPSGLTVDTSALADINSSGDALPASSGRMFDSGTAEYFCTPTYNDTTSIRVRYNNTTPDKQANVTQAAPFTFASGDYVTVNYEVPIVEWAGGSQDTITVGFGEATTESLGLNRKKVSLCYALGSSQATGGVSVDIELDTLIYDNTNGNNFNTGTGYFTAPKDGAYMVSGMAALRFPSGSTNSTVKVSIFRSGSGVYEWVTQDILDASSSDFITTNVSGVVVCSAGDTIYLKSGGTSQDQIEGPDTGPIYRTVMTITELD